MRLFIALELPPAVLRPLVETAERWRPRLPSARWVPAANLHLTLRFLGEVEGDRVSGLDKVLASCFAGAAPFDLTIGGGGCFPPGRPGRVGWVGFEPAPQLEALQEAVASSVEEQLDLEPERRPFHAHLTLARPRRAWPRAAVDTWQRAFDVSRGATFRVEQGQLMRSRLEPGGARHDTLGVYRLGGVGREPV